MTMARAPQNDLEKEFKALVDEHREEFAKLYGKLVELSDKTGIPFGTHIPEKFKKHFWGADGNDGWNEEEQKYEDVPAVSFDWAGRLLGNLVDQDFWQSSTTHCELYY